MVLDTRQLEPEPEPELKRGKKQAGPQPALEIRDNLDELLSQAATGASPGERARAVERLRLIAPSAQGVEVLWSILATDGDPRRLVAAQVLGYHRGWGSSRSSLKRLLACVRRERDPEVGAALVRCLRQRNEVQEFLLHKNVRMAREAALGLPLNSHTLARLLEALMVVREGETKRILFHKLRHVHPSQVRDLVDHLLQREWRTGVGALVPLFECLPQVPLFELFVQGHNRPEWDPRQGFEPADDSRKWHQFARSADQVLRQAPGIEILRYVMGRSGEDEGFARRHASFLREILHQVDEHMGPELLKHLERLTHRASEDKVARLAQLLVEFSGKLEGQAGAQASALLEEWKGRSAALKLKIYHLQQGLS